MTFKRITLISLFFFSGLAIVLLPSLSTGIIDIYNEKRLIQLSVLFLSSLFFGYLFLHKKLNLNQYDVYLWSSIFVLLIISILSSEHVEWALLEIGWYAYLLQFAFVSAYLYQQFPQKFEWYLLLIVISFAALYSIRIAGDFITGFVDPNWPNWPDHTRSVILLDGENFAKNGFLGFKNVRFFNHLQTWSLPILIYGYIKYQVKLNNSLQILFFLLISFFWMLSFASGARGTLLSLLIGTVVVLIIYKRDTKEWLKKGVITCLVGFLLYIVIFHVLIPDGSGKSLARADSSRRLELWGVAWQAIKSNLFLGLGPMHIANVNGTNPITSPHNIYLMWMAEWGIPAFLVGGIIALKSMYKWIQSTLSKISTLKVALTISFVAGMIHSGVSGLLITPLSQLLFALLLGWAVGIYFTENNQSIWVKRPNGVYGLIKTIPLLLITAFLCVKVGASVPHLEENKEKFQYLIQQKKIDLFPTSRATIYPRFWEQGFIGIEEINMNSKDIEQ